jgi:hypothetical protein
MRARPGRDRLAVCTFQEAGEEIPNGDPSVTDAERAAAGRETLAERFAAVLPGNRRRAADRYTAGGLPDGEDVARVWRSRDPAELRARLTEPPLAIWSSGDVLHVLWQGQADEVQLCGGVQPRLWPVEGTGDLWEVSLRIRHLDQAVISVVVASRRAGGDWPRQIPDVRVWRGPRAPAAAALRELHGSVSAHTLHSAALRGERGLTVYQPPGAGRPVPGCLLADGEAVRGFAPALESAIEAGAVPPVLLVGVVVHVAGYAGQGAVIDVGEGGPEHDRRENVGAVDDGGGYQGRGDEQPSQDGHDVACGAARSSAGMTPSCWNTSSRLSSSQCSANSPLWTRQMSIDRISIGRPAGGMP